MATHSDDVRKLLSAAANIRVTLARQFVASVNQIDPHKRDADGIGPMPPSAPAPARKGFDPVVSYVSRPGARGRRVSRKPV